jgi:hypothetical protein
MKKFSFALALLFVVTVLSISLNSCEKDAGKLPNIAFITTSGYTSSDVTKHSGDTLMVGINASKAEDKDILKTFTVTRKINTVSTDIESTTLSGAQVDAYSKSWSLIPTGSVGDSVRYTFTVVNKDGLTNAVSFKVSLN